MPAAVGAAPRSGERGVGAAAPIAILGGGLAGLSLALQLYRAGLRRPIEILEPRATYGDDRTWCFWATVPHPFESLVATRWRRWRVTAPDGAVAEGTARYPYCRLPAGAFYESVLAELARAPQVRLHRGVSAGAVATTDGGFVVDSALGRLEAGTVFDARPPAPGTWPAGRHPVLWQDFLGWRVRTTRDAFDPGAVDLMDFRRVGTGHADIRFLYVLPLSAREALVEATVFAATPPDPATHRERLHNALADRLGGGDYTVTAREAGRIPMTTAPPPAPEAPGVIPIGTRAGAPRPSTGYAFLAIQDHVRRLAAATAQGRARPLKLRGAVTRGLDRVFLTRLRDDPSGAPWLFHRLVARVPGDRLVRFLSERGTPGDHLAVMAALPTAPFLKTALDALWTGRGTHGRT